jgi:CrcB protein
VTIPALAWVGLGGAAGAMLRYAASLAFAGTAMALPWGTLFANLTGCFGIGVLAELVARGMSVTPEARLFLATGLCGGFTTMSSFIYELAGLWREGATLLASAYLLATLVGSAVCFGLGAWATHAIWRG